MNTSIYNSIINIELFKSIPEMVLLNILEYINNGPFVIYYDKKKKGLTIGVDRNFPIITKSLIYKQCHPPEFYYIRAPKYKLFWIKINYYDMGFIIERILYNSSNNITRYNMSFSSKLQQYIRKWNYIINKMKLKTI